MSMYAVVVQDPGLFATCGHVIASVGQRIEVLGFGGPVDDPRAIFRDDEGILYLIPIDSIRMEPRTSSDTVFIAQVDIDALRKIAP